ncbi:MAG: hypothetical protein WC675_04765 [Patescibacteria group bacterium]|jgi:hypothetical protein
MIKNLKLALGLGAGMWAVMFIGVCALMVTPLPVIWQQILEIILSGVAAFVLGRLYFRKHPGGVKDGLILGVSWFILGGILDLLVTIQYVKAAGTYLSGLKSFYSMWNLWVGFLLMFGALVIAALTTRGGQLMKPTAPPPQPQQPPVLPKKPTV